MTERRPSARVRPAVSRLVRLLRRPRLRDDDATGVDAWSEARYRSLVEALAQIIWGADEQGEGAGLSPLWLAYTGQAEEQAAGAGWLECVHPDDRAETARRWKDAVSSHGVYEDEYRLRDRRGGYRVMSVRAVPVRDDHGRVREWVGVSTDVTASRTADELVRVRARQQLELAELGRLALAGGRLQTLFAEAARTLCETLGAEIAVVLEIVPPGDEFLLRASHGWGQEHVGRSRTPVEASWAKLALQAPAPVMSGDLHADGRFTMSPLLQATGAVSAVAVRIGSAEAPFGVIEALSPLPRRFGEADGSFLTAIANVLAIAVDRRRAEDALASSEERLRLALGSGQLGTWEWEIESGSVRWSEDMEAVLGLPAGCFGGTFAGFRGIVHPDDLELVDAALAAALQGSEGYEIEFRFVRPDGTTGWIAADGIVLRDETGAPVRMIGLAREVTSRKRREESLEFLAEAGEALQSLDSARTLAEVVRLAVPRLADCCIVDIVDGRDVHQLGIVHVDPEREALVRELEERYPSDVAAGDSFLGGVLRERRARLVGSVDEQFLAEVARDDEHLAALRRLGLSSVLAMPLIARGRALGMITMLYDISGRRFGTDDLALSADLARHAALAVDNARLYEQRSDVAGTLQRSLLPPDLPHVPGVELAARYRAVGEGLEVGGDFYDAFAIDNRGFGIAIGDVCGKGVAAAAVTGLARHTIRAAALREASPVRVLEELNVAILREHEGETFCTAAVGVLEPGGQGARLAFASGGHPLPLVVRASGEVARVGAFGTLVGVFPDPELSETALELAPGDALVFFTDGLVEGLDGRLDLGEAQLARILAPCAGLTAEEIASRVEEAVAELGSAADRDDIAFLVLRVAD